MKPDFRFSRGNHPRAALGESPAVDEENACVWWVDVTQRRLFRSPLEVGQTNYWDLPEEVGFVVLDEALRPIIGMQTGIYAFEPKTAETTLLIKQEDPELRFNDATIDANGTLWVSTIALNLEHARGKVFRVNSELRLEEVIAGLTIPNGMAVDIARQRIYVSDSHWDIQKIWTLPINSTSNGVGEPTLFASTAHLVGRPDGAIIDTLGRYWIAAVDGAALYVYGNDGQKLFDVPLPIKYPTKAAFWGKNNEKMVITSKADNTDHGPQADGGQLLFLDFHGNELRGAPPPRWHIT